MNAMADRSESISESESEFVRAAHFPAQLALFSFPLKGGWGEEGKEKEKQNSHPRYISNESRWR